VRQPPTLCDNRRTVSHAAAVRDRTDGRPRAAGKPQLVVVL